MVNLFGVDLGGAFDAIKGATSDLFQNLDLSGPQQAATGGRDPFGGLQLGGGDPFKGLSYGNSAFDNLQLGGDPFAGLGGLLGGSNPQTGYSALASFGYNPAFAAFDQANQKVAAKARADEDARQQAQIAAIGSTVGTTGATYTGLPADVAKWADQANQTFGDQGGWVPAAMLAIIQHESGGSPSAYNGAAAGGAWGLFQQMGLGSNDPNTQFAAAKTLLQDKLKMINASYQRLGLNPDDRTRARDLFLAWAGQFDPNTAGPSSARDVGNGQDANTFLNGPQGIMPMYDNVVRGRQQASAPAGGSTGMAGITPGVGGQIMQDFGVTPTSQGYLAAGNHVYDYGSAYGLAGGGHPGVDWAVPRGSQVATPLGGTVSIVGNDHGTGYYYQDTGNPDRDHSGEFAITLDNGDILILGHMSRINAQVGQRINAGALIGLSGGSDGDHVHVEYRRRNANGGYTVIDPRTVLGQPTGGGGAGYR